MKNTLQEERIQNSADLLRSNFLEVQKAFLPVILPPTLKGSEARELICALHGGSSFDSWVHAVHFILNRVPQDDMVDVANQLVMSAPVDVQRTFLPSMIKTGVLLNKKDSHHISFLSSLAQCGKASIFYELIPLCFEKGFVASKEGPSFVTSLKNRAYPDGLLALAEYVEKQVQEEEIAENLSMTGVPGKFKRIWNSLLGRRQSPTEQLFVSITNDDSQDRVAAIVPQIKSAYAKKLAAEFAKQAGRPEIASMIKNPPSCCLLPKRARTTGHTARALNFFQKDNVFPFQCPFSKKHFCMLHAFSR